MPGQPFIGEIMPWAGNFAPVGWLPCEGQLVPIAQYDVLFALIGTTYGGDGINTFALPDLRGRASLHSGQGAGLSPRVIGQSFGSESATVTAAQLPSHNHAMAVAASSDAPVPNGRLPGPTTGEGSWAAPASGSMASAMVGVTGGTQPHENRQPYLAIFYCIATEGIFPSQT